MKRILGLDLIRAIAILSVLLCHTMALLYPFTSGWSELLFNLSSWATGFYGVEIFFILSGFLIGSIFIKKVVMEPDQENQSYLISDFWMRRWVRTLPNYFLFLCINFLLIPLAPETNIASISLLKYLFFLQSLLPNTSAFFGVSWSLAVEEWFYLLLPILFIILLVCVKNRRRAFVLTLSLLLIIPTLSKVITILGLPLYSNVEGTFHYGTLYKLDSIFYGLLLAWAWHHEPIKNRLIQHKHILLLAGLLGLLGSFVYAYLFLIKPIQNSILVMLYAPLTSLSIVIMFPFLYDLRPRDTPLAKGITFISLISYSLYLVHVPIINVYYYFAKTYSFSSSFGFVFIAFLALNLLSIGIAFVIYTYFELPTLAYRERLGKLLVARRRGSVEIDN